MDFIGLSSLTVWKLLALDDADLERFDLVAANLAVARDIESLQNLDISRYCRIVDEWTERFRRWLPSVDRYFRRSPQTWKNEIRFFHAGMLQHFLCHEIGLEYAPEERKAVSVQYVDPCDLFLNGLIDSKLGTCGNMAALHVAICRRMGWPVSIACAKNHQVSRFDDGKAVFNIECTVKVPSGFSADSDEYYLTRFKLPKIAQECGSDLRKLSMREMLGVFVGARARHYQDVGRMDLCDVECCLARTLLPKSRSLYTTAMIPYIQRGEAIFAHDEVGHPQQLREDLAERYRPQATPTFTEASIQKTHGSPTFEYVHKFPLPKAHLPAQMITIPLDPQRSSTGVTKG